MTRIPLRESSRWVEDGPNSFFKEGKSTKIKNPCLLTYPHIIQDRPRHKESSSVASQFLIIVRIFLLKVLQLKKKKLSHFLA